MATTRISAADTGSNSTYITEYSSPTATTDGATGEKETRWQNNRWSIQYGYYKDIDELQMAIRAKAMWTIGKGFTSNPLTTLLLSTIKGYGSDTFNSILENMVCVSEIGGDAYAEIIRDDNGLLVNLKPLDPSSIVIIADSKGIIKRYEQVNKHKEVVKLFEPEDIFHIANNRVADNIHGTSTVDTVEWVILALKEAQTDYKLLLHRNIYPVRIWHLDTDVESEIASFKAKVAQAKGNFEDLFIPKDLVEPEIVSVPENGNISPMSWIDKLTSKFYRAVGTPQIIIGGSQELTQTAAQIAYLAFEQVVEQKQLYIEEQVLSQLNLKIELSFPASLQNNLLSDAAKDGTQDQQQNQPSILQPPAERGSI